MRPQPSLESVVTCPHCGIKALEVMPNDACLYFYECTGCHMLLRPKAGDCCVFCSYGSVACPPIQLSRGCCDSDSLRADARTQAGGADVTSKGGSNR